MLELAYWWRTCKNEQHLWGLSQGRYYYDGHENLRLPCQHAFILLLWWVVGGGGSSSRKWSGDCSYLSTKVEVGCVGGSRVGCNRAFSERIDGSANLFLLPAVEPSHLKIDKRQSKRLRDLGLQGWNLTYVYCVLWQPDRRSPILHPTDPLCARMRRGYMNIEINLLPWVIIVLL